MQRLRIRRTQSPTTKRTYQVHDGFEGIVHWSGTEEERRVLIEGFEIGIDVGFHACQNPSVHGTSLTDEGNLFQERLGLGDLVKQSVVDHFLLLVHEIICLAHQYREQQTRYAQKVLDKLRGILRQNGKDALVRKKGAQPQGKGGKGKKGHESGHNGRNGNPENRQEPEFEPSLKVVGKNWLGFSS